MKSTFSKLLLISLLVNQPQAFAGYSSKIANQGKAPTDVQVIKFAQEGNFLVPQCAVNAHDYPGVIPGFVENLKSQTEANANDETLRSLPNCDSQTANQMVAEAEDLELQPKVAVAQAVIAVGIGVVSCAFGALQGVEAGALIKSGRKHDGTTIAALGLTGAAVYSFAISKAYPAL